jgi:hypothetical protein
VSRRTRHRLVLLGPQRLNTTVADAARQSGIDESANVATVTAGWQEREPEDRELNEVFGGRTVNLTLWTRTQDVFAADPELAEAHHARQALIKEMQALYQARLSHHMAAYLELAAREETAAAGTEAGAEGSAALVAATEDALASVRALDRRHLARLSVIHREFAERWVPTSRDAVVAHCDEIRARFDDCAALAIAGGHVATLLNCLRLFDIGSVVGDRLVLAWSAGAMATCDRVVVFHDHPPHGRGDPAVLESGLGWHTGIVPLPHVHRRLHLDDPLRVATFARRFAPAALLGLEDGAWLSWTRRRWRARRGVLRLGMDGRVEEVAAA